MRNGSNPSTSAYRDPDSIRGGGGGAQALRGPFAIAAGADPRKEVRRQRDPADGPNVNETRPL